MKTFDRVRECSVAIASGMLVLAAVLGLQAGISLSAAALALAAAIVTGAGAARRPDWRELLNRAIGSTPVGLCLFDSNLRVITSNEQFAAMYGLTGAQVRPGSTFRDILGNGLTSFGPLQRLDYIDDFVRTDRVGPDPAVHELCDGRIISVSRHAMAGGGLVEIHRDITNERLAEERANLAMQALLEKQYAIDQAVIVAITDVKGTITYANDNFCKISEYAREELIGQNHRLLKSGAHGKELFQDMYRCLAKGQVWRGEICNRSKSGRLYWVDTVITPQLGAEGKPISYMAIRVDITARKEAEAKLSFAARHDALTGLLNRSAVVAEVKAAWQSGAQAGCFSVHLVDLDGFKSINDTLGHNAGDDLLKQVASRLRSLVGGPYLVARLGGDEFAVIGPASAASSPSGVCLGQLIVEAMTQPFEVHHHKVNISASVGVAHCPDHGSTPEDLLKKADLALYDVKAAGRNGYRLYQPRMLEAVEAEKAVEAKLRTALARGEFELHYQPILDVATRSTRAAEALVRWRHPADGLIPPADFIPVAEHTGLILPLSEWIIEHACRDAASWPGGMQLAVNVSAIQFKRGNLFDLVMRALLQSGLSPHRLQLEVTETALLEHQAEQLHMFRKLKNLGVALVLDDFGTGYSFDKIKIDRSFVQGVHRRECSAVIASAVALAKGLGITITAEGIETEEQFGLLRSMGVDFAQGYLFSRPMPHEDLAASQGWADAPAGGMLDEGRRRAGRAALGAI
jgi:diguanylate cyclase (GGDEF)-like protein/PAS domain S-box-containing protein